MKNTFNRFFCFVVIFGVFALCGIFTSCENLFGGKTPINYEKAYIRISTDMKKSVLPSEPFSDSSTGLTWTLTGSLNGGAVQELGKWSDTIGVTEASTTTAYNKMISDTSIILNAGSWTFTLSASNDSGKLLLEATIEQKINGGENTLSFVMEEAVGEGAASGQIEFTLKWEKLGIVDNVFTTLSKRNGSNFSDITSNLSPLPGAEKNYEYVSYSAGADSTLTPGNYILKLELQQQTGTTEATENTSEKPIYETINTYTCLIHVAPGLCSKGGAELKTLAQLYEVTFEGTEGIEFEEDIVSLSYNAYTTFALPTIEEKDGYEYQWHQTGYDPATGLNIDKLITEPLEVSIDENAHTFVLYRYKIVAEDDIFRTAKGDSTGDSKGDSFSIRTAEGLGIFRDLVNGCNENLKMVDKSGESKDGYVYYDYGLVSYQSLLNAKLLEDIDLTDGNELSWVPINGYSGTFDGGGYTITVNNTYQVNGNLYYQGFFDTLDGATIKNLVVAGEETISESGLEYCGGIASQIENARGVNTTFENCVNKRNITVTTDVKRIGGFAGYTLPSDEETNFVNCINLGTIENNYNASEYYEPYVAGFTSGATSYRNCINAGNVTGATFAFNETSIFGTVAGFDASVFASFTDCINLGDISANLYTFSDGKFCSTGKVYGFSSIENEINKPSFTNCIDAGSAKYPFTGVGEVTYNTCYYNSDSYGSSDNTDVLSFFSSNELCIQEKTNFSNWSYDSSNSRYPLPKIEANFSEKIWQEVVAKAIPKVSNFEMLQNRIASANGTAENPAVIELNSDIIITETLNITTPIKIIASTSEGVTITRGLNFIEEFFNNTSTLTLEGITLDGGSTGEISIQADAPLIISSGSLTLNNCTLQNNKNSNATETGTGIFLQINDTSSLCSFNDVSFGKNSSDEIPHIKIENNTDEKFTFNLGGNLAGGVPSIDMPSTTCINITESLALSDGESIKITLDEYTIGNRIISANEGINLVRENFSLTTTDESWFIDSTGYLAKGDLGVEPSTSETGEYVVSSLDNLLWIARGLKTGSITSFNIKLTEDIVIESGKWQFYQLNVSNSSTIDGQGHSITIDEDVSTFGNDAGGLFYKFNNSTVKNLVLKGSITANTSAGGYIGALCRSAYGSIFENVMSEVTITDNGSGFAGGLIGRLGTSVMYDPTKAMVKNCAVYADVSSTNGIAGGILGAIWENTRCCTIQNSVYMGEIKGTPVGAIVGKNENNNVAKSVLNNIWYCVTNTNDSSIPLIGTKADTTTEDITDVESKSADDIASDAAATLLNTTSDGTSNDAWEYVSGDYPTLKIVN